MCAGMRWTRTTTCDLCALVLGSWVVAGWLGDAPPYDTDPFERAMGGLYAEAVPIAEATARTIASFA